MKEYIELLISNRDVVGLGALVVLIDWITGVTKAIKTKSYESEKFKKIISKFIIYTCAILLGGIFDVIFNIPPIEIGTKIVITGVITKFVILCIIITESSSVVENFKVMGFSIPFLSKFIADKSKELKGDEDSE